MSVKMEENKDETKKKPMNLDMFRQCTSERVIEDDKEL